MVATPVSIDPNSYGIPVIVNRIVGLPFVAEIRLVPSFGDIAFKNIARVCAKKVTRAIGSKKVIPPVICNLKKGIGR